ncbi:BamA/TamA family outer membrane protein [Mucilaginibacter sp. McL0603]|uniref:translocation and assembly module lipoprotein TamL n=1 Tax=Mucilaginibacter sp. McL0603 TaxID=3415670 RepID=UPI003CEBFA60
MNKYLKYLLFLSFVLFNACSNTKYLQKGQKLYTGGEIKIDDKNEDIEKKDTKAVKDELEDLLRPKPNSTILGMRVKLYIYNKTRTTKKKGLRHYINTRLGQPPVLISDVDVNKNSDILQNRLQNESYFQSQVVGDTLSEGKTAKAIYTVQPGPTYTIRKIVFPNEKGDVDTAVAGTAKQTLFVSGNNYNLDVVKNERIRIDARLKEEGFYYFSPDYLIMRVDSTVANHQVDIYVKVKNETPDKARRIYRINNIYLYPHYTLRDTALKLDSAVTYRWYHVIDTKKTYRPFTFKNSVLLHPGDIYNRSDHNKSLSRFINLGPFKFVKNRFEDVSTDSSKLDIYYFLTPYPKKSLQFELLGRTTTANYVGSQISLSWKNRNAFKGAEEFKVKLFASTDVQYSGQNSGYNVYQFGIQPTITWPRFISPFNFNPDNAFIPHTELTAGYTLVDRVNLYTLNSFNASFGYNWKQNAHVTHDLSLLTVTLTKPANVTQEYLDSIEHTRNPTLAHVIDQQFTFGPAYSYTYTNTNETFKTNTIYYSGRATLSGNLYGIITGADTLAGKVSTLFGLPFNQFIKIENEFRYFHKTGPNSTIASRIIVGVGLPYGNSTQLPYSQQFSIGGSYSLRGFRARSVGPGSYMPGTDITSASGFLPDESGDIKIEANVEYRPKLFSIVYGGLFVDAGNIWNLHSHEGLPGGAFGKNFLSQMAMDTGFGLRFDLTLLVFRADLGVPIRQPYEGAPLKFDFNNRVFNLAIGYPF